MNVVLFYTPTAIKSVNENLDPFFFFFTPFKKLNGFFTFLLWHNSELKV